MWNEVQSTMPKIAFQPYFHGGTFKTPRQKNHMDLRGLPCKHPSRELGQDQTEGMPNWTFQCIRPFLGLVSFLVRDIFSGSQIGTTLQGPGKALSQKLALRSAEALRLPVRPDQDEARIVPCRVQPWLTHGGVEDIPSLQTRISWGRGGRVSFRMCLWD